MKYICPNCNCVVNGYFCSNCGQKKYKRIDRKYIWEELQYTVFHTNKGFLYSVKNLIVNPGRTAKEFIDGKRVNHYKPILLAFVLSGISAFISFKVVGLNDIMKEVFSKKELYSELMNNVLSFVTSYSSFMMLFFVPFLALFSKIAFRKWGQNYYEHVVMNAYMLSFHALVNIIVIYPIMFFTKGNTAIIGYFVFLSIYIIPFVLVWFYKGFYKEHSLKSVILKVLLILLMIFVGYMFVVFALATYLYLYKPEMLQQMQN
jgi:Protein of unknown function (DUF3667).